MIRARTVAVDDGRDEAPADATHDAPSMREAAPWGGGRRLLVVVLVAVNLAIVVATVRGLSHGWLPIGDNGILLVRARDVGTANHPWLGSWTSASLVVGGNVNNPGPLYFDALAPTVRLLGPWVGLAVGVMLVNVASSSLAVVAARRIAGASTMVAVAVVAVALQFVMGSELLYDVWQPNALVLPFLAFLVVVAVLATGDLVMLPWVLGVGSLLVQTHMSHAVLVGVLSLVGVGAGVWARRRGEGPVAWRGPVVWGVVVVALAWVQPLIEQFTGHGEGNLSRIASAATAGEAESLGLARATRVVGEVAAGTPWFTRQSYERSFAPSPGGPDPFAAVLGVGPAAAVVAAMVLLLVGVGAWAWATGRRGVATMAGTATVAVGATVVALASAPVSPLGVAAHQMRWVWPVTAFVTATCLAALLSALPDRPPVRRPAMVFAAALVAVVALANLPTHPSRASGPVMSADLLPVARELVGGLDAVEGRGTVLFDATTLAFAEPYSGLVFAEMQDRGIPFVFDDEGFIRQFGEGRRDDGSADLRLWQVEGPGALTVPSGAERIALVEGPSGPVALLVEPIG